MHSHVVSNSATVQKCKSYRHSRGKEKVFLFLAKFRHVDSLDSSRFAAFSRRHSSLFLTTFIFLGLVGDKGYDANALHWFTVGYRKDPLVLLAFD